MTTYSSPGYTNNVPVPTPPGPANVEFVLLDQTVTCAASPSTADTLNFGYLPANSVVTGAMLKCSDMDTNGSPALTLNIGDAGLATRLFSGSTAGQTGTTDVTMNVASRLYNPTTKTLVTGVAGVNAATGAAGTVRLVVFGFMLQPTTSGV